jgi:hypothetical protein
MKLNGKMMVAVAMILGATATVGCNAPADLGDGAVAPQETPATAPVEKDSAAQTAQTPGVEQDALRFFGSFGPHYYAPIAPPAVRYEVPGRAPSARHFWAPGYYRWNGREHVWIGGRWEARRDGFEYVGPRWEHRFGRFEYLPGRWVRR